MYASDAAAAVRCLTVWTSAEGQRKEAIYLSLSAASKCSSGVCASNEVSVCSCGPDRDVEPDVRWARRVPDCDFWDHELEFSVVFFLPCTPSLVALGPRLLQMFHPMSAASCRLHHVVCFSLTRSRMYGRKWQPGLSLLLRL